MDTYDYDEDNLSAIARSCNYASYMHSPHTGGRAADLSCSSCRHWNGGGCSKNHLNSIASELRLD